MVTEVIGLLCKDRSTIHWLAGSAAFFRVNDILQLGGKTNNRKQKKCPSMLTIVRLSGFLLGDCGRTQLRMVFLVKYP